MRCCSSKGTSTSTSSTFLSALPEVDVEEGVDVDDVLDDDVLVLVDVTVMPVSALLWSRMVVTANAAMSK